MQQINAFAIFSKNNGIAIGISCHNCWLFYSHLLMYPTWMPDPQDKTNSLFSLRISFQYDWFIIINLSAIISDKTNIWLRQHLLVEVKRIANVVKLWSSTNIWLRQYLLGRVNKITNAVLPWVYTNLRLLLRNSQNSIAQAVEWLWKNIRIIPLIKIVTLHSISLQYLVSLPKGTT